MSVAGVEEENTAINKSCLVFTTSTYLKSGQT